MFKKIINYIKDFVDKCIFFYNNDEVYKKRTKNILFLFLGIDVVFLIVCYFINKLDVYNYIIFSLIVFAVWFVVQVLYSFFVVPSDYIQPNIDKLPNKIWNYPVVVQYNLPKWLNPSEVWMLYCKDYESTNVTCMVYKRENEWLIKMEDKWKWSYILHRNGEIGNNAPDYERRYWSIIFWYDRKQNVVWNDINPNFNYLYDLGYVHIELLKYCKEKWWLEEKNDYNWLWIMLITFLINPILLFVWIVIYFVYKGHKTWHNVLNPFKKFYTTNKWDELLAQIIWYKYWLEKCEEEQMKKILEDDPWFKSRTFPYIVALRMNWKLLDKSLYS